MASRVPNKIVLATARGDVAMVGNWLESGGDANQDLPDGYRQLINVFEEIDSDDEDNNIRGQRLLEVATEHENCDLIRILIAHGAEVDNEFIYYGTEVTALYLAINQQLSDAAKFLIESGADVNRVNRLGSSVMLSALLDPPLLRALLIAGADASAPLEEDHASSGMTPEAYARSRRDYYVEDPRNYHSDFAGIYGETVTILEGTRLAGSYKNYVLQEYKELLRLRSLLARKRASIAPTTPEVVARLFGGRADPAASRRATRRRRPPPPRSAGVPGPVFWKVMEYWRLGDWRHP